MGKSAVILFVVLGSRSPDLSIPVHSNTRMGREEKQEKQEPREIEVRVRTLVRRLMEVSSQDQHFKVRMQVEASWEDGDLKFLTKDAEKKSGGEVDVAYDETKTKQSMGKLYCFKKDSQAEKSLQCFFAPRLRFDNLISKEDDSEWFRFYDDDPEDDEQKPVVVWGTTFTGVFQEAFELHWFPLDYQPLTMRIVSSYEIDGRTRVHLVKNQGVRYGSKLAVHNFLQAHEYFLFSRLNFVPGYTKREESASGLQYPYLDMSMRVKRYPWNWFFNCVLPLFIIQGSLISSYAISSGFQDRAGVSITLLLAIVAFKYSVSEKLPTISYLTLIDMYVLGSFLINAVVILDQTLAALGIREGGQVATVSWGVEEQAKDKTEQDPLQISGHLLIGLTMWLGIHLGIVTILAVRAISLMREEEYVTRPRVAFPTADRALPSTHVARSHYHRALAHSAFDALAHRPDFADSGLIRMESYGWDHSRRMRL